MASKKTMMILAMGKPDKTKEMDEESKITDNGLMAQAILDAIEEKDAETLAIALDDFVKSC